jgi:hypothetical protein
MPEATASDVKSNKTIYRSTMSESVDSVIKLGVYGYGEGGEPA